MPDGAESSAAGAGGGAGGRQGPDDAWREELAAAWGQSSAKRGALRSQYAAVRATIRELKDDPALGQFDAAMDRIEKFHEKVQRPMEQLRDGEALLDLADALVSSTKAENREGPTPSEFVTALLRKFSVAATSLDMTSVFIFQPDELALNQDERNDTQENMAVMFRLLGSCKSVKLEHLILNRQSFAQPVENIFALSLLVKDGRAEINVVDNGIILSATPRNAPAAELITSRKVINSQFMFRFDTKDWEIMKRVGQSRGGTNASQK
ncbi:Non-structural maintenance of chromosomes element 4-like protein A [Dichanthelium oligosanthes]|uniref:Non-structural maintenance of chromosomes element 4 n=1 Tax=Dichanthelium oligosanthes TaxID=888268 RepID=A0A1E5UVQ7_9POAL|nr:Non-structural maintenance of chromosomes element 4-like protein A [Dichanthelium oligosanthes]